MQSGKLLGAVVFGCLVMNLAHAQTPPDAGTLLRDQQAQPLEPLTLPRER